ncbi:MAG: hypothetical protein IJO48_03425 [Clostridia bacterium]|nr:hypothetical protein [Clostridia bacterium]
MKKAYTAPTVLVENFKLSEHIAASCAEIVNHADGVSCIPKDEYMAGTGVYVFMSTNPSCYIWYDSGMDQGDLPCYHQPSGWNYFQS